MSLQFLEPKDAVGAQGERLEVQTVQRVPEDIPKATRCELQDPTSQHPVLRAPVCSGLGPRHQDKPPHFAFSFHCSSEEEGRGGGGGGGGREQRGSHMKFSGSRETGGQGSGACWV